MSYHLAYTAPILEAWRAEAACAGRSDVFLPRKATADDAEAEAKRICGGCPVSGPCLSSALADEKRAPAYARVGVRGGLTAIERARLAGAATEPNEPQPYDEIDRLLRGATMTDRDVARQLGIATTTVHRRRKALGLPRFCLSGKTPEEAFAWGVRQVDGGPHAVWHSGTATLYVGSQNLTITRLAFRLGHGREPDGLVQRSCDHDGCIAWQHLADKTIRAQAREALGQAA